MIDKSVDDFSSALIQFLFRLGEITVVAALYFAVAWLVVRFPVRRLGHNPILNKYGKNGSMIALRLVSIGVYLIAIIGILSYLNVNTSGILTLMSAFTVAIGLALQDVMRNLIAGLFMLAERPFQVGDTVGVRDREGVVQGIDIRTTMLRTEDGIMLMVPNQLMFTEILRNKSRYNLGTAKYRITTPLDCEALSNRSREIADSVSGVRDLQAPPRLVSRGESGAKWEIIFPLNEQVKSSGSELDAALLEAFPDAEIGRIF